MGIFETIQPVMLEILGLLITAAVAYAAVLLRKWTGIEMEARHREALHSALLTGVRSALANGASPDMAVNLAVSYAHGSVPDAISALNPNTNLMANLARSKLDDVARAKPDDSTRN